MTFELLAVLDTMEELYSMPLSPTRFQAYLSLLQGNTKGDMVLPIGGYNPMAKDHLLDKIAELKTLEAESIMAESLKAFNARLPKGKNSTIKVVLNIADDLKGGWTNRHTTDFDSKFKINALVERKFCAPYVWSSEQYTPELIRQRTLAYASRTLFWQNNGKPPTLAAHLAQEVFVQQQLDSSGAPPSIERLEELTNYYQAHQNDDDYNLLFNFFYGDEVCQSLSFPCFGLPQNAGFEYAKFLAA